MSITPPEPLTLTVRTAVALEAFLAIGALGGGAALLLGPRGEILPLPLSALAGSPFADYTVPGAILFLVIGLGPLVAAVLTWRRHRLAPLLACATGGALIVWLAVEIAIVGYSNEPVAGALPRARGGDRARRRPLAAPDEISVSGAGVVDGAWREAPVKGMTGDGFHRSFAVRAAPALAGLLALVYTTEDLPSILIRCSGHQLSTRRAQARLVPIRAFTTGC